MASRVHQARISPVHEIGLFKETPHLIIIYLCPFFQEQRTQLGILAYLEETQSKDKEGLLAENQQEQSLNYSVKYSKTHDN